MIVVVATVIAAVIGAVLTASFSMLRNMNQKKRDDDEKQGEINAFLEGVPGVPGVTNGAKNAAVRMMIVEDGLNKVADGQALLEKRMDEANGTGKRTEQMVKEIVAHLGLSAP